MKIFYSTILILSLLTAHLVALEIVANGDFEDLLTTGWSQRASAASFTISRNTTYDPDPDYEARIYQSTSNGFASLYQIEIVPSTDIDFSGNAKVYAWDNSSGAWGGAAIIIGYVDGFNSLLGETFICARSTHNPWTNTATRHLIEAADSSWHSYSFNLNDELANLSGVNPGDVEKLQVSLYTENADC
jgi:hypothetical protein